LESLLGYSVGDRPIDVISMPGEEREFNVGLNLDVLSPGSRAQRCGTYPNADSMKDFWSTTANKDADMDEVDEAKGR
jgi:hypothetical protein